MVPVHAQKRKAGRETRNFSGGHYNPTRLRRSMSPDMRKRRRRFALPAQSKSSGLLSVCFSGAASRFTLQPFRWLLSATLDGLGKSFEVIPEQGTQR
jgi:hypothetical protein